MNKLVIASAFTLAAFSASAQLYGEIGVTSIKIECPVFEWFETDGLISQRRDWLIGFKV